MSNTKNFHSIPFLLRLAGIGLAIGFLFSTCAYGDEFRRSISCENDWRTGELDDDSSRPGPSYRVDLSQALTRYVTVLMVAESEGDETVLMMPTWTPGSYLIREYAKHIDQISASDMENNSLPIEKISKNRWRVSTSGTKRFQVFYRLFCDEVSVRTNSVNFTRAVLNGAPTFLSIPQQQNREHRVKLILPKNWSVSCTSLRASRGEHTYYATNYDEIVDSPIVAGNLMIYPFEVAGVPHYIVNVGQSSDFDSKTAIKELTQLVEQHQTLWGEVPYDRYYFITVIGGGGGGLEHDNSCLMMVSRLDVRDRASYRGWLNLASHEFFHAWNIRRLRPKELVQYDYEKETYTPSLWIAEGLTSYYEDLLMVRAGLLDRNDFVQALSNSIQRLQRTDGRLIQSLRDSSHDAWIKFYRPESNSNTTQISYYSKGAIVGLLLDTRIRSATGGQKSLDDVLRIFWQRHKGNVGYSESEFRSLCSEVAGEDLTDWFHRTVDSTEELDYQELANWFGFEVGDIKPQVASSSRSQKSDDSEASEGTSTAARRVGSSRPPRRWIGVGEFDSPATKAGLADTDEVIAINGNRVRGSIEEMAQRFDVGEPVKVLIARNGEMEEILLVVGARPPQPNWGLKVAARTTRPQRQNFNDWLASTKPIAQADGAKSNAADGNSIADREVDPKDTEPQVVEEQSSMESQAVASESPTTDKQEEPQSEEPKSEEPNRNEPVQDEPVQGKPK
jgi:predicted metalloprotease with PDZ domain